MNDTPFLGAHGFHVDFARSLFGFEGQLARHVFDALPTAINIPFDVDQNPFGLVGFAGGNHPVQQVLQGFEIVAFSTNQDGGIG